MCQTINDRIKTLRAKMTESSIDYVLISLSDPHMSEYVADCWKVMEWISGFTGSAGMVIITQEHPGLWTDSRYFIQAEKELAGSEFELYRVMGRPSGYLNWLKEVVRPGERIALDGRLFSVSQVDQLVKTLNSDEVEIETEWTVLDDIWKDGRVDLPNNRVFCHPNEFDEVTRTVKLQKVRDNLHKKKADWQLISSLDEVAFVLNLRGVDVQFNPVFYAYVLVGQQETHLFINPDKIEEKDKAQLKLDQITIRDYGQIYKASEIARGTVLVDSSTCNYVLKESFEQVIHEGSMIKEMKSIKTELQLDHLQKTMIKDGLALVQAFHWLENELKVRKVKEYEFALTLEKCRAEQPGYFGESFSAIVGYESNGAIVHYRPHPEKSASMSLRGILLCDSGGQYFGGTTDITRTMALSPVSTSQALRYTLVLKGHIAVATAHYPVGTTGNQIDTLARQYLWKEGLDYGHGTGHGVGFFLNVHESPPNFSPGYGKASVELSPGMVVSNEPGFYLEGEYGIRIENLVVVMASNKEGYLYHKTLTLFPIDKRMIDRSLLTGEETDWLDAYHREVYETLSANLDADHRLWLEEKCSPL